MKEKVDEQLNTLLNKVMNKSTLETPSFDFTAIVMSQVERVSQSTVTAYQPLISKRVWALILVGFISFVAYVLYIVKPEASGWFNNNAINTDKIVNLFSGWRLPRIVAYGVGLLSLMLLVQIPFLKRSFDKRILS